MNQNKEEIRKKVVCVSPENEFKRKLLDAQIAGEILEPNAKAESLSSGEIVEILDESEMLKYALQQMEMELEFKREEIHILKIKLLEQMEVELGFKREEIFDLAIKRERIQRSLRDLQQKLSQ